MKLNWVNWGSGEKWFTSEQEQTLMRILDLLGVNDTFMRNQVVRSKIMGAIIKLREKYKGTELYKISNMIKNGGLIEISDEQLRITEIYDDDPGWETETGMRYRSETSHFKIDGEKIIVTTKKIEREGGEVEEIAMYNKDGIKMSERREERDSSGQVRYQDITERCTENPFIGKMEVKYVSPEEEYIKPGISYYCIDTAGLHTLQPRSENRGKLLKDTGEIFFDSFQAAVQHWKNNVSQLIKEITQNYAWKYDYGIQFGLNKLVEDMRVPEEEER